MYLGLKSAADRQETRGSTWVNTRSRSSLTSGWSAAGNAGRATRSPWPRAKPALAFGLNLVKRDESDQESRIMMDGQRVMDISQKMTRGHIRSQKYNLHTALIIRQATISESVSESI